MVDLRFNASIGGSNFKITLSSPRGLGPRRRTTSYARWLTSTVQRTGVQLLLHYLAASASNAAKDGTIISTLTFAKKSGHRMKIELFCKCTPNMAIDGVKSLRLSLVAQIMLLKIASTQSSRSMQQKIRINLVVFQLLKRNQKKKKSLKMIIILLQQIKWLPKCKALNFQNRVHKDHP